MEKNVLINNSNNEIEYAGKNFHELSEEEMINIVGGTSTTPVEPRSISTLASGFVLSWLGSAALNCK